MFGFAELFRAQFTPKPCTAVAGTMQSVSRGATGQVKPVDRPVQVKCSPVFSGGTSWTFWLAK